MLLNGHVKLTLNCMSLRFNSARITVNFSGFRRGEATYVESGGLRRDGQSCGFDVRFLLAFVAISDSLGRRLAG
jgi:hypothetical protein